MKKEKIINTILITFNFIIFLGFIIMTHRPLIYGGVTLSIIGILECIFIKKLFSNVKVVIINLSILLFFIALIELYLDIFKPVPYKQKKDFIKKYSKDYRASDHLLGYIPRKDKQSFEQLIDGNNIIFNVKYTINKKGIRISPHDINDGFKNKDFINVLFFGCSFTYGEGLNDNETFPWQIEEMSNFRYKTYNFGFHGYGPNQMLRMLEINFIDEIVDTNNTTLAFFLLGNFHLDRVSGKYPAIAWCGDSPRYVVDKKEIVKYKGKFFLGMLKYLAINKIAEKSSIAHHLERILYNWKRTKKDSDLLLGILKKSKIILKEKYNTELYVIIWNDKSFKKFDEWIDPLNNMGIPVILMTGIIPDLNENQEKYILADGHPNKLSNNLIANYLFSYLQGIKK